MRKLDRNDRILLSCAGLVAAMVALTYASAPFYALFCKVTGFGGTPQVADGPSAEVLDRMISVRFDANTSPDLDWDFVPLQTTMRVHIGETAIAFYRATNRSERAIVGNATYNVTPDKIGYYFEKVQCFCFSEQRLEAGETIDMPVVFYVDPAIIEDPRAAATQEITLSYTFFPALTASRVEKDGAGQPN
ncbi:MAG: cytochrome c oxidase assembly protein [Alphaproteobacteria bacterium]|nr:cytochrome c oxidase assembly protein [Alphaproteobacteria bacterium]